MEAMETWLKREFQMDTVSFVEKQSHGHFLRGTVRESKFEFLVVASGHVWIRKAGNRSWKTTATYAPDRILS